MCGIAIEKDVPDVVGFIEKDARETLEKKGFLVGSVEVTKSVKSGMPEGEYRVVRQVASGKTVELILVSQKWV